MSSDARPLRALLIAIDDYPDSPLSGCLNDIQHVSAFLTEKLKVPAGSIRKLVAPRDGAARPADADERAPTYANLVAALQELAGPKVKQGDRVFIYYSGHGSFQKIAGADAYFEGLVPLDHAESGLLFDVEMNGLLQAIANRSGDLSVVLDCCHSAGATRDAGRLDSQKSRFLEIAEVAPKRALVGMPSAAQATAQQTALAAGQKPTPYSVLAACHADERAAECRLPSSAGKVHGLLTSCLFAMLAQVEADMLSKLRWSDIWEPLKGRIFSLNPNQRPQLLGPPERRIFGGPWAPQDPGYPISRKEDGSYLVGGGSLAGLGKGAQLAVYGPEPALFPPLDSEADQRTRLGVVVVESVKPAEAIAWPIDKAVPVKLPQAARGRLIKPGAPDLLRVAVSADLDPAVRQLLDESRQWDGFRLLSEGDASAEVHVGQYPNGDLWIGDDLNGPGAPLEPASPGPLGRVRRSDCADDTDRAVGLRAGLSHYAQYVIPLRAYRNGGFSLSAKAIEVTLLDGNDASKLQRLERDASARAAIRRDERGRYRVKHGDGIVIHIQNTLTIDLFVHLLFCSLEGQSQLLYNGAEVTIQAGSGKLFWSEGFVGHPLFLETPKGVAWGIDRIIVIATDRKGMKLSMLNQKDTMDTVIRETILGRATIRSARNTNELRWMATQTLIQIGEPPSSGGVA